MIDTQRLKQVDLKSFLHRHYGLSFNSKGFAHCPFHPPDNNASFKVMQDNGRGQWFDFHCQGDKKNFSSDIIGFVMLKDGISFREAGKKIEELEGLDTPKKTIKKNNEITGNDIAKTYDYLNESGNFVWQKIRIKETSRHFSDGKFRCRKKENGQWIYSLNGINPIPYRLNKIKGEQVVFLCEGEKDSESLVALGYATTTAPFGKGSWSNELTQHFAGKEINIIYDVGNEQAAYDVAENLSQSCDSWILGIPLKETEADLTDYLSQFPNDETKKTRFEEEVLWSKKKFTIEQKEAKKGEGIWGPAVKFIQEELDHGQFFALYELCQHLGVTDPEDKKKVARAVSHLVSKGDITKGDKLGTYKKADAELVPIDLLPDDKDESFRDFRLPLLEDYIKVERGDVLLFAGFTSTGKTCLALNFCKLNQHLFTGTDYFSNQHGQVNRRLASFKKYEGLNKEDWKFQLYARTENFAPIINPAHLTIIDFLDALDGDYSKMGSLISQIHNRIENEQGIVLVFIQKPPGRDSGYGNYQTHSFANFSATLDDINKEGKKQKRIKIIKSKLTPQHEGKVMLYKIDNEGTNLILLSPLEYPSRLETVKEF